MKGVTITFECQLCSKKVSVVGTHGGMVEKPPGWAILNVNDSADDIARLYPAWQGNTGPDVLPRLFCSTVHLTAFTEIEAVAAKKARAAALEIEREHFRNLIKPAKLRAMDAVTALATAVADGDAVIDDGPDDNTEQ
jgi:hypothetical protein